MFNVNSRFGGEGGFIFEFGILKELRLLDFLLHAGAFSNKIINLTCY